MTVTKEMIMQVSPFSVSDSGDFDVTDFEQYKIWAGLELDQIDPGLDSPTYDMCHALLICHIYDSSRGSSSGGTQYKSEKIGDYSYTRAEGDSETIVRTSYYNRMLQLIKEESREQPTVAIARDDTDETFPKAKFKLDQNEKVVFE